MKKLRQIYLIEANELMETFERLVLRLEGDSQNAELIQEVFRCMHTLKDNSSMLGIDIIAGFVHNLETIYDFVRTGQADLSKQIIDVTFDSVDHLNNLMGDNLMDDLDVEDPKNKKQHKKITDNILKIIAAIEGNYPDYKIDIEEGATMVRLGSSLFRKRDSV